MRFITFFLLICVSFHCSAQLDYFNLTPPTIEGKVKSIKLTKYLFNPNNDSLIQQEETSYYHFFHGIDYSGGVYDALTETFSKPHQKDVSFILDSNYNFNCWGWRKKNIELLEVQRICRSPNNDSKFPIIFCEEGKQCDSLFSNATTVNTVYEKGHNIIIGTDYCRRESQHIAVAVSYYVFTDDYNRLLQDFEIDEGDFLESRSYFYNSHQDLEFVIEINGNYFPALARFEYEYDEKGNWVLCKEYSCIGIASSEFITKGTCEDFSNMFDLDKPPTHIYKRQIVYE